MNSSNSQSQQEISQDQSEDPEEQKDQIVEQSPKGRFLRFNEELGFGAYKTVYKGYDNDSGCEIAWNVIKLQRLPQQERKRISEEISLLKNLRHKNIINFINAWMNKTKNEIIFITECLSGGSLKKYLNRIRKPRLKIIKIWCKQILAGLQYLHEQEPHPIIHRDIKCENIFVNTVNNEIRIGDLGLALTLKSDFTTSVLGTPEFMAPEIYEEKYGTPVDIYAFGMCLLEMATLQIPYKECTSAAQVYKKVSHGLHPQSLQLIQNEQLKTFILKCIQNYELRPSAAQLLLDDFFKESEIDNLPIQLATDRIPSSLSNPSDSPLTPHQMQNNLQNNNNDGQHALQSAFKRNSEFESPIHQVAQKQDNAGGSSSSASKSSHSKQQKESNQPSPSQSQNSSQSSEKQMQQNQFLNQPPVPKYDSQNSLSSLGKSQNSSNQSPLNNFDNHLKKSLQTEGISMQKHQSQDSHQQLDQNTNQILLEEKIIKLQQEQQNDIEIDQQQINQIKVQKTISNESLSSHSIQSEVQKEKQSSEIEEINQQSNLALQVDDIDIPVKTENNNNNNSNVKILLNENSQQQSEQENELKQNELGNQQLLSKEDSQQDRKVQQQQQNDDKQEQEEQMSQKYYVNKNIIYTHNGSIVSQVLPTVEKRDQDDFKMRKITEDSKEIQDEDRNHDDYLHRDHIKQELGTSGQFSQFQNNNNSNRKDISNEEFSFEKQVQPNNYQSNNVGQNKSVSNHQYSQSQSKQINSINTNKVASEELEDNNDSQQQNFSHSPTPQNNKSDITNQIQNQHYNQKLPSSTEEKLKFVKQKSKSGDEFYLQKIQNIKKEDISVNNYENNQVNQMQSDRVQEQNKINFAVERSPGTIKDSLFFHDQKYDQLLKGDNQNQKNEITPNSSHNLNQFGNIAEPSEQTSNQESGASLDKLEKYSNKSQEIFSHLINNDSQKRVSPSTLPSNQDDQMQPFQTQNDHSDGYSIPEQNQLSKQASMIEIQQQIDQDLQNEISPYSLTVKDEKELKNQKFWIRFLFQNQYIFEYFEIDNSLEDFSESSIFAFAQQKAAEFDILDYSEQFAYDLYNLVCEKYNSYHSEVSQAQKNVVQEDIGYLTSIHPNVTENNVLEIFARHYQNYMKEIEEYLKSESSQFLKIRQSKEQIQLHRFHLNQQENQIDYESQVQIQMTQKSPQTIPKVFNVNQQQQPQQQLQIQQQQIIQYGNGGNNNQDFYDSPEVNNLQKKMNNISAQAMDQFEQVNYQNTAKQGIQSIQFSNTNPIITSNNSNSNNNNQSFNGIGSFINPQVSIGGNNIGSTNNSNNPTASLIHFNNSNINTQGNINSSHLSPNSSINTFEDNQEQQVIQNLPLPITRSGSFQINTPIGASTMKNTYFTQNSNYSMTQQNQKIPNGQSINQQNKNFVSNTGTHQQQQQMKQRPTKEIPQVNQVNVTREGRHDTKVISHSQSFSNITSQTVHKIKQANQKSNTPQESQNINNNIQTNSYSQKQIQSNSNKSQYNTQNQSQQVSHIQQSSNPSFFQQNQINAYNKNQQSSSSNIAQLASNSNNKNIQQQQQQQYQNNNNPIQQTQSLPINHQSSYPTNNPSIKQQKFINSSDDSQPQTKQNYQNGSHQKHLSQQVIKQSLSQEQFLNSKIGNIQDESNNPYQLHQQFQQQQQLQHQQIQQQQQQQYVQHNQYESQGLVRKNSNSNNGYNSQNPPFFIQPLDARNGQQQQQYNQNSQQIPSQQISQNQLIKSLSPPSLQNRKSKESSMIQQSDQIPPSGKNRQKPVLNEQEIMNQQIQQQKQQVYMISPTYSQSIQNNKKISEATNSIQSNPVNPTQQQSVFQTQIKFQQSSDDIDQQNAILQSFNLQNQKQFSFNKVTSVTNLPSPQQSINQSQNNQGQGQNNQKSNPTQQDNNTIQKQLQQQQQQQYYQQQQQQQSFNGQNGEINNQMNNPPQQSYQYIQQTVASQNINADFQNQSQQQQAYLQLQQQQQQQLLLQQQQQQQQFQQQQQSQQQQTQQSYQGQTVQLQETQGNILIQPQNQSIQQSNNQIIQVDIQQSNQPQQNSHPYVQTQPQLQQQQQQQVSQPNQGQINSGQQNNQSQRNNSQQAVQNQQGQSQQLTSQPNTQLPQQQIQQQQNNAQQYNNLQSQQIQQQQQVQQPPQQQQTQQVIINQQQQQQSQVQQQNQQGVQQNQQIPLAQISNQQSQQIQGNGQIQAQSANSPHIILQQSQNTQTFQNQINSQMQQNQPQSLVSQPTPNNINATKNSPSKIDEDIKKIIQETKMILQRPQVQKYERISHDKVKDEGIIKLVQRSLKILLPQQQILENGQFGNYTEQMIKIYQKQHSLNCTGAIEADLLKSILVELENLLGQIENKISSQQQKDQTKKQMIKHIQSQQSKETLSNFENKFFNDFSLNNDDLH